MSPPDDDSRDAALERALVFNFVVHGVAIVTMALLLMPMLPGGGADDARRVATIATHPWRFRAGWVPWHLCALADLLLAVALVRTRWIPRAAAIAVLALTSVAVVFDQWGELAWETTGVVLARGELTTYLAFERMNFPRTAAWGALFYTLAALGWTYAFARARTWSRTLSVLSFPLWGAMFLASLAPIVPAALRPAPAIVAALNAVGFALLQLWLGLVTEEVLRRRRPVTPYGRWALWRHPRRGVLARMCDALANSRLASVFLEPLPEFAMLSDIRDVVYVNYLVPAERVEPLVPPGLELQRLGADGAWALFTFLSFRHGHFGFRALGPLRRWLASPIQTNWRIHVRDPRSDQRGVMFLTNAISATVPALVARLTTEGMPMHVLAHASIDRDANGTLALRLDPGEGSAPDAVVTVTPSEPPELAGPWRACFASFRAFLEYCVPQDRAMSSQPWKQRVSRQEIRLGIPIDACVPASGRVTSRAVDAIVGDAVPVCFVVPAVRFQFSGEVHEPMAAGRAA